MPSSDWFYVQDRQKVGPVSKDVLRSLFEQGTISEQDLVWTHGMSEWKPAGQVQARFGVKPASNPSPNEPHEAGMEPALDMETPVRIDESAAKYDVGEPLGIERKYAPTTEHVYAHFGLRLAAFIVDSLIVSVLSVLIVLPLLLVIGLFASGLQGNGGEMLGLLGSLFVWALMIAIPWLYYARQESGIKMATIGKRVMGLQVIDTEGYPLSFMRATGRYFGKMLSGMFCGVGYFLNLFTEKKQTLHDLLASCVVVKVQ